MSEEEIIKKIKDTIQYDKEHRIKTIYDEKPLFRDYLQGLLDLYKQEKEKNKELETEKRLNEQTIYLANNTLCGYHEGYQAGLHKEITATELVAEERKRFITAQVIKRLKDTIYELHNKLDEGNKKVRQDYISKDKIREKIKELEKTREMLTDSNGMLEISASIDILKELLEERN